MYQALEKEVQNGKREMSDEKNLATAFTGSQQYTYFTRHTWLQYDTLFICRYFNLLFGLKMFKFLNIKCRKYYQVARYVSVSICLLYFHSLPQAPPPRPSSTYTSPLEKY